MQTSKNPPPKTSMGEESVIVEEVEPGYTVVRPSSLPLVGPKITRPTKPPRR